MTHEELQDLLAAVALGTASPRERAAVEEHLASGCEDCRRSLADFRAAAAALPFAAVPETPPARVKARLMAKVRGRRFNWMSSLAMAATVLIVVSFGRVARQRSVSQLRVVGVTGVLQADGRAIRPGEKLSFGQKLVVSNDGVANIQIGSRAVFHLNAGSEAVVVKAESGFRIDLQKGGILSFVKTGTPYTVNTPIMAAAARGTVFYVQVDSPDRTSVCICHGKLHLEGQGLSEDIQGEHHNPAAFEIKGGILQPEPVAVLQHSDQEIAALAEILH